MKYVLILLMSISFLFSQVIDLQKGWNHIGSLQDTSIMDYTDNASVEVVWYYDSGEWIKKDKNGEGTLSFLLKGEGQWVYASQEDSIVTGGNTHADLIKHFAIDDDAYFIDDDTKRDFMVIINTPIERFKSLKIDGTNLDDIEELAGEDNIVLFGNEESTNLLLSNSAIAILKELDESTVKRFELEMSDGVMISKEIEIPSDLGELYFAEIDGYIYGYRDATSDFSTTTPLADTKVILEYTEDGKEWKDPLEYITQEDGKFRFSNLNAISVRIFAEVEGVKYLFYARTDTSPIPKSYSLGTFLIQSNTLSKKELLYSNFKSFMDNHAPWLNSNSKLNTSLYFYKKSYPEVVGSFKSQRNFIIDERRK